MVGGDATSPLITGAGVFLRVNTVVLFFTSLYLFLTLKIVENKRVEFLLCLWGGNVLNRPMLGYT